MSALRVGSLDLLRRRMRIRSAFVEIHGKLIEGTPKTHQMRTVPLPRFLIDELAAHVEGKGPDDLVFSGPTGAPLRNTNFRRRRWDKAVKVAGLDGLTPHDLRHTAASLSVAAGANVKSVQRMLGHASATMTLLDVYAGLSGTTSTPSRTCSTRPRVGRLRTQCGPERPGDGYCRSPRGKGPAVTRGSVRAREGNRTLDLRITSALLCRLSYSGGTCHSSSAAQAPPSALFCLVNPYERVPHRDVHLTDAGRGRVPSQDMVDGSVPGDG